jgi:uncharacterized protein YndB with AHSA1/START domain
MNSEKSLIKEIEIEKNIYSIWNKFTTEEGLISFFAPEVNFQLSIGGQFEMLFDLKMPLGLQGSEDCKILSFLPHKMLSFSWNNPPKFENIRDEKTWVVIEFVKIDENKTKITLTHLGWKDGPEWDGAYEYFNNAWNIVLKRLEYSIKENPIDWENPYYP